MAVGTFAAAQLGLPAGAPIAGRATGSPRPRKHVPKKVWEDRRPWRESPVNFSVEALGVYPHAGQAEFLSCRAPTKAACCGRRWGKTFVSAIDLIWFAFAHPGTTQWVLAPTADQARIMFRYITHMVDNCFLREAVASSVTSPFARLEFKNGSIIHARGVGPSGEYLRGHGADRILADEAAYLPPRVLQEVIPGMLLEGEHHELILISTPFGMDDFWDTWSAGQRGDPEVQSFAYPTWQNPRISQKFIRRLQDRMPELAFDIEIGAKFREDQNAVFRWSLIQKRMFQAELPTLAVENSKYAMGYDPAKYTDQSGLTVIDYTTKPWRPVLVEDVKKTSKGRDYDLQAVRVAEVQRLYNGAAISYDATKEDSLYHILESEGVEEISRFNFTEASKDELFTLTVNELEKGRLEVPSEPRLIKEMQYYQARRKGTRFKLGVFTTGMHDDLVTSLALAVWQAKMVGSVISDTAPVPLQRRGRGSGNVPWLSSDG